MDIKKANRLHKIGVLTSLYKAGFISVRVFTWLEITNWVNLQMEERSINKKKAVMEAKKKFRHSERTIYRALNSFK